tara:strand:+ start:12520 stop:12759 length:240 start_codon:yes stop_codon:yes gene_type:complete
MTINKTKDWWVTYPKVLNNKEARKWMRKASERLSANQTNDRRLHKATQAYLDAVTGDGNSLVAAQCLIALRTAMDANDE